MSAVVGSVTELRRYPVKSLVGELLRSVEVDARGVVGDRSWALRDPDGKLGSGKSTRRFRKMEGLLGLSCRLGDGGVPVITFPDGRLLSAHDPRVDDALSEHVGRPVRLLPEGEVSHFDEGPLHLVSTASLVALADEHGALVPTERLRPNLVLEVPGADGLVEDGWVGRTIAVGPELVLSIREPMVRCVMVGQAQIGLPPDDRLLRALTTLNDLALGVVAEVVTPGVVSVDDRAVLLP